MWVVGERGGGEGGRQGGEGAREERRGGVGGGGGWAGGPGGGGGWVGLVGKESSRHGAWHFLHESEVYFFWWFFGFFKNNVAGHSLRVCRRTQWPRGCDISG